MLYPGDATCSYKPIQWWKPWNWPELFFDTCLILKQWFKYVFPQLLRLKMEALKNWVKCNHVRIHIGYVLMNKEFRVQYPELYQKFKPFLDDFDGVNLGFHWTSPRAEFFVWQSWMTDPSYARIYRYINSESHPVMPVKIIEACLPYDGMLYDYGQLIDMGLGLYEVFDFGKEHKVCSVGVRIVMDKIFEDDMIPGMDPEKTLPCSYGYTPKLKQAFE